jgi:hypothetical protein
MDGDIGAAKRLYERAVLAATAARDLDALVESQTWQAEALVQAGRPRDALPILDAVESESLLYARYFTDGWPPFVLSEALGLVGDIDAGRQAAEAALERFRRTSNVQGIPWALIQLASLIRLSAAADAKPVLADAEHHLAEASHFGRPLYYASIRMHLERVELERATGNLATARKKLHEVESEMRLARSHGLRPTLFGVHVALLRAVLGDGSLGDVIAAYRRIGARYHLLLAQILAWRRESSSRPTRSRLLARARREGYGLLSEMSTFDRSTYLPIPFV